MSADRRTALARSAEKILCRLILFWPQESRQWGLAMAAESSEIGNSWAALLWLLGGLTFFLRSVVLHFWSWLRLPAGVRLNTDSDSIGEVPPPTPKHSRLVTAALLFAAAFLLVLPQGREAITAVRTSWSRSEMASSDKQAVEALAARAIREKDARVLAFAAISYPEREKSEKWSEKAVAMDASLRWMYATHATWGMRWEIPESHLRVLREYDPENSFVYLLSADRIYRTKIFPLYDHGSPTQEQISQLLADDPQWVMWMEKALQAPRYDSYEHERYELGRQIWSENRHLSPEVLAQSIQSHAWPDAGNLMAFSALRIQEAEQARRAGDTATAEQSLEDLVASSDRLIGTHPQDLILAALQTVQRKCLNELKGLYSSTGRTQDAAATAEKIAQLEKMQTPPRVRRAQTFETFLAPFRWKAYCVQLSALALLFFVSVAVLSLMTLEIAGLSSFKKSSASRTFLCFAADYAPMTLLVASTSFVLTFRPFAHAFDAFRSGELPVTNQWDFLFLLYSLRFTSPTQFGSGDTYPLWWAITIFLSCIALFILIRPLLNRRYSA